MQNIFRRTPECCLVEKQIRINKQKEIGAVDAT